MLQIISVLLFCTLLFYGIQIAGNRYVWVAHLQVLTVLPLIGIIYYFYRLANTEIMQRFFQGRCWNFMGMTIGRALPRNIPGANAHIDRRRTVFAFWWKHR